MSTSYNMSFNALNATQYVKFTKQKNLLQNLRLQIRVQDTLKILRK